MLDKKIIKEVTEILNRSNVIWGVGGSYLLKIYDLIDDPKDLDLWVSTNDISKLRKIFSEYQEIKTEVPLPPELHYKILYKNLEVDFVACFIIKPNQYEFKYNIKPQNIRIVKLKNGIELPCTYLEDWYIVYKLLKRNDKAKIIEDFFYKNKMTFSDNVIQSYKNSDNIKLPKYITENIQSIVSNAMQLSFSDIKNEGD